MEQGPHRRSKTTAETKARLGRLELAKNHRDLALLNLAIDSKLLGCDLVKREDVESVRGFIEHRVPTLAMEDRSGELIWHLFMALALNIRITGGVLTPLFHVEDPMCALLISQAADRGLVRGPIDQAVWNQSISGAGLESTAWPYAYEGPRLGIIPGATFDHIENHPYFSILHQRNVATARGQSPCDETSRSICGVRRPTGYRRLGCR